MSKFNPKTLSIAAIVLVVLALLFLATPLLRPNSGFTNVAEGMQQFRSQTGMVPGQGFTERQTGSTSDFMVGGDPQNQAGPSITTGPSFTRGPFGGAQHGGILGIGILNGTIRTIIYAVALLASLAAALGIFTLKRWGRILGIFMAAFYSLLALISFVASLLTGVMMRNNNTLSIILSVAQFLLAISVIVFASIHARQTDNTTPTPAAPPVTIA